MSFLTLLLEDRDNYKSLAYKVSDMKKLHSSLYSFCVK